MAKGLAVVIGMGKPKGGKGAVGPEEPAAPMPSAEDDYGAELADMLGVKDAAAFTAALKGFISACTKAEDSGEYDEAG